MNQNEEDFIMLIHKGTVTLHTPKLTLRRLMAYDAQPMFDNFGSDVNVPVFLSWETHKSVDDSAAFINSCLEKYEKLDYYCWAIEYEGSIIGTIGIHAISDKAEHFELGYQIGSRWWGLGIMTEVVQRIIRFGFEELNANKINALHDTGNPASGRVMEKNGMIQEGLLREHKMRKDGTRGNLACYSILKSEWRKK
jgi:ribosomal-protein-alanine N-acetyltransferase